MAHTLDNWTRLLMDLLAETHTDLRTKNKNSNIIYCSFHCRPISFLPSFDFDAS